MSGSAQTIPKDSKKQRKRFVLLACYWEKGTFFIETVSFSVTILLENISLVYFNDRLSTHVHEYVVYESRGLTVKNPSLFFDTGIASLIA